MPREIWKNAGSSPIIKASCVTDPAPKDSPSPEQIKANLLDLLTALARQERDARTSRDTMTADICYELRNQILDGLHEHSIADMRRALAASTRRQPASERARLFVESCRAT